MRCYEALCDACPWRGCRPLDMRFCDSEAYAPTALRPPPRPPCTHVWVAGVANMADEGEVMRCCKDAGGGGLKGALDVWHGAATNRATNWLVPVEVIRWLDAGVLFEARV
jgi:hypothetical protein